MWIKRSTYEKLQDEYDKLQISNLLLGRRLTLSERKLEETEVKNGLEIVPELKWQISELKDQNKVMREMLKETEEKADDDCIMGFGAMVSTCAFGAHDKSSTLLIPVEVDNGHSKRIFSDSIFKTEYEVRSWRGCNGSLA